MPKIAFVTDSTAYIPTGLCQKYNIAVAPQILIWGEETFLDGVDIQPNEFYARLKTAKVMPSTAQVSVVTMQKMFQGFIDQGYEVLGIFISDKLSGTFQSAIQGREALGKAAEKVVLHDSHSTAMAMGFQVLSAARVASDGGSLKDCIAIAEKARNHTGVYFAVDTLEFLHRGGRIGGAQRFIGSALNLKPVLALEDGHIEAIDRIRTKTKALDRVVELVAESVEGKSPVHLATLHANAEEEAKSLMDKATQQIEVVEKIYTEVSPVVGAHAGPGTVALAYMAGM
ncbi:MAG TPA: DegV family protein [Anaerolineales bacterium]|nr:DegV family protein [Anaerolineales bacterium]